MMTKRYLGANLSILRKPANIVKALRFDRKNAELVEGKPPFKANGARSRERKIVETIGNEFDEKFYETAYPEVRNSGLKPIEHYVTIGWREGKDPSPNFNTRYYLTVHADVSAAGMNPLFHFIRFGRSEGRAVAKHDDNSPVLSGGPLVIEAVPVDQSSNDELKRAVRRAWRRAVSVNPPSNSDLNQHRELVAPEFDVEFYLTNDPALRDSGIDPIKHFLEQGWREHRDPNPNFSVSYYLDANPDIKRAGINPFIHYLEHGRREGRQPLSFLQRGLQASFAPLVSVVVPNYNHAKFLPRRLDSILRQSYENIEILILDDASQDDSADIIRGYEERHPGKIRAIFNERNSGSVFAQWRKGIEHTTGSLIWICESDDFCELDFLEKLVPQFVDQSVMLGFGRIQFAGADGNMMPGLDAYRDNAERGIWAHTQVRCASDWFCNGFGVSNLIANVGGCLLRRQDLPAAVWRQAEKFRVAGDWFLYVMLAGGGRIAYVPDAIAYFRQHGGNTSVKGFHQKQLYLEQQRVFQLLRGRWGVSRDIAEKFYARVEQSYIHSKAAPHVGKLERLVNIEKCMAVPRTQRHVLVGFLGFQVGGGELIAIHLANALLRHGYLVSVMCLDSGKQNDSFRAKLDSRIPVYDSQAVKERGVARFIAEAGIDVISSHNVGIEYFFFVNTEDKIDIPYIVSLHGSYEVSNVDDRALIRFLRGVSHWVYTAERNLRHLQGIPLSKNATSKIDNGMPGDMERFPQTRKQLGIGKNDFVFTLVARPLPDKGWEEAIKAVLNLQSRTSRAVHLLLCGAGGEEIRLRQTYGQAPNIHFLGFQSHIHGLYRLTDCTLLPTRFRGESFPLCLIQTMQVGTPIISTKIGNIGLMMASGKRCAGLLIEPSDDNDAFVRDLEEAMLRMLDEKFRKARARDAKAISRRYSIDLMAKRYSELIDGLARLPARASS
jgi:glycosyltransferase involved in cell wall biosynthesis